MDEQSEKMLALLGCVDDRLNQVFSSLSRANAQTQSLRSAAILAARAGETPALPGYVDEQLLILFGFLAFAG
jgi:hypothetical protein